MAKKDETKETQKKPQKVPRSNAGTSEEGTRRPSGDGSPGG